jgi:5-methylcytosine-specific restriction endonuclease McrA
MIKPVQMRECVYCGNNQELTRDHVPPKGIFSEPRPSDLITVPACPQCHNAETSRDDEYFRLHLQVRDGICEHPDVIKARPTLLRSLEKPGKAGMRKGLLENIVFAEAVTPSGIFIKNQLAIQTNTDRLRRVVSRTMKGLFYYYKQHRLPDGYDALVFDEENVQKWPANVLGPFNESVIQPLLAQPAAMLGNGVFSCRFGFNTADQDTTYWIFVFYGQAGFLGLTQPSADNV